ncbi:MAG: extracellular solute-binding protein [Pseudomonadota bacterium]
MAAARLTSSPGVAALKALKPNVRKFYKTSAEVATLLDTGDAPIAAMATDIRVYGLADAGKPVKFVVPKEGAMVGMVSYHIAKNSPNQALCKAFVNFALSRPAQEGFCNGLNAGPVTRNAMLSGAAKDRVPPLEQLLLFDWKKVVPQMSEIAELWNREMS